MQDTVPVGFPPYLSGKSTRARGLRRLRLRLPKPVHREAQCAGYSTPLHVICEHKGMQLVGEGNLLPSAILCSTCRLEANIGGDGGGGGGEYSTLSMSST